MPDWGGEIWSNLATLFEAIILFEANMRVAVGEIKVGSRFGEARVARFWWGNLVQSGNLVRGYKFVRGYMRVAVREIKGGITVWGS